MLICLLCGISWPLLNRMTWRPSTLTLLEGISIVWLNFLTALCSDFEGLCGSILHRTPLPTVDSVVHELIVEETHIKSHAEQGSKCASTLTVFFLFLNDIRTLIQIPVPFAIEQGKSTTTTKSVFWTVFASPLFSILPFTIVHYCHYTFSRGWNNNYTTINFRSLGCWKVQTIPYLQSYYHGIIHISLKSITI